MKRKSNGSDSNTSTQDSLNSSPQSNKGDIYNDDILLLQNNDIQSNKITEIKNAVTKKVLDIVEILTNNVKNEDYIYIKEQLLDIYQQQKGYVPVARSILDKVELDKKLSDYIYNISRSISGYDKELTTEYIGAVHNDDIEDAIASQTFKTLMDC